MDVITCAGDWLDMRVNESGLVRGGLHGALRPGAHGLVVSTRAWELVAIDIPGGYDGDVANDGDAITVAATRTEDGLSASSGDITIGEEIQ